MRSLSSNNPIKPLPSASLERNEMQLQSFINSLARKMIRKDAREREEGKKTQYYIHGEELIIIPIK